MLIYLESKGIKIDGVGFQSHHKLEFPTADEIRTAMQGFVDRGYKIKAREGKRVEAARRRKTRETCWHPRSASWT